MGNMRSNLSNNKALYLDVPRDRRNVQNRELKALLDRIDPEGEGHLSLSSMRRVLTKLLPSASEPTEHRTKRLISASLPSLLSTEEKKMSQYERARPVLMARERAPDVRLIGIKCCYVTCVLAAQSTWLLFVQLTLTVLEPYRSASCTACSTKQALLMASRLSKSSKGSMKTPMASSISTSFAR